MIAGRDELSPGDDPVRANGEWWDRNADSYLAEHGDVLGDAEFIWGPEGLNERDIRLLGSPRQLAGRRILEIGSGAAQCSRFLALEGHDVTASDIAPGMLSRASAMNDDAGVAFPLVEADARNLPFDDYSFDVVFTSFGVLPFVEDLGEVHREVRRVLTARGRWVFSAMHPVRWMFPDDPTRRGLGAQTSYFDRRPYQERTGGGTLEYAEFQHTFADHINSLIDAGFTVTETLEPQWPAGRTTVWGGWGPERSPIVPGTLIIASERN